MKDWLSFILIIVLHFFFVANIVLGLFWPDVLAALPALIKWLLFLNCFWMAYWLLVEVFVRKY